MQPLRTPTITTASILAALLLLASAALGSMPSEYKCNGNEPFWGLAIDGEHAGWATPEEPAGRSLEGTYQRLDFAGLFAWRGSFGDGDLVAFVADKACSDTMADRDYPFSASISLPDGTVVLGCCDSSSRSSSETLVEPSDAAQGDPHIEDLDEELAALPIAVLDEKLPGDWSRSLFGLLPAIGACLAKTGGSSPRVVKAWAMGPDRVGVRTSDGGGAGFECVASRDGTSLETFTALSRDASSLHGGWSPFFTLPQHRPPVGECYQHERVVGDDDQLLGWLSYDTC